MICQRVLPPDGLAPKMEATFQQSGKLLGIEATNTLTLTSSARPGGFLYGEGTGILMTKDGEAAMGIVSGLTKLSGTGMAGTSRGAVFFQTQSPKLARLNSTMAVVEVEQDENGNTHVKMWEWK